MSIDGIGGGKPPIGPSAGANGAGKAGGKASGEGFSVDRTDAAGTAANADGVSATADLERLNSGEISVDDYLKTRADKAVAHLESVVSADQLSIIKEQLVHQMKQDPSVAALVQRATGILPTDNES
jgi:hypothetical protein